MPAPLSQSIRSAVADDIRAGLGRNAIARKHHVSPGYVSKVARDEWLSFDRAWMTAKGSEAHRINCAQDRIDREEQILKEMLALSQTFRQRDGRETKASRRLDYKLYDLHRHHTLTAREDGRVNEFPWEQLITAGSTLAAGLLGYLLAGANEARRDRRALERDLTVRAEDRVDSAARTQHEFQLENLLALQDAVQNMGRLTVRAMHFDHMQARQGSFTQLPPDLSDELYANGIEVNKLRNRLLNAELRTKIEHLAAASHDATGDPRMYENQRPETVEHLAASRLALFSQHATSVMDALGETLRAELEWRPAHRAVR